MVLIEDPFSQDSRVATNSTMLTEIHSTQWPARRQRTEEGAV